MLMLLGLKITISATNESIIKKDLGSGMTAIITIGKYVTRERSES